MVGGTRALGQEHTGSEPARERTSVLGGNRWDVAMPRDGVEGTVPVGAALGPPKDLGVEAVSGGGEGGVSGPRAQGRLEGGDEEAAHFDIKDGGEVRDVDVGALTGGEGVVVGGLAEDG